LLHALLLQAFYTIRSERQLRDMTLFLGCASIKMILE
jgi:hypothetical protein